MWIDPPQSKAEQREVPSGQGTLAAALIEYAYRQSSSGTLNGVCETALVEVGTNHLCSVSTNV